MELTLRQKAKIVAYMQFAIEQNIHDIESEEGFDGLVDEAVTQFGVSDSSEVYQLAENLREEMRRENASFKAYIQALL